jgi:MSHA pilin protein MshD
VTLIEVIVFILIVSIALTATVGLLGVTTVHSSDPLGQRQTLAAGEALMQEIDAVPYRQKNPYNPTGPDDGIGPEAGESRSGSVLPFDNPNDYAGYSETGLVSPDGTPIPGLSGYSAQVAASEQALGNIPASSGLLVTVTVAGPLGDPITIASFRAMYAP